MTGTSEGGCHSQGNETVYGRNRKEFFLDFSNHSTSKSPLEPGYESDFHAHLPRGQRRNSFSRSSSRNSGCSNSSSEIIVPTYTLQPARFDPPSRSLSPHQYTNASSSSHDCTSSSVDYRNVISRANSPHCPLSGSSHTSFPLPKSSFPQGYNTSFERGTRHSHADGEAQERCKKDVCSPPFSFSFHQFPSPPTYPHQIPPVPLALSPKARGKQREIDPGDDTGYESSAAAFELADLCLESNFDHPPYGTVSSTYEEMGFLESPPGTARSVSFNSQAFQNSSHARQFNYITTQAASHPPLPRNPVVLPGGFIPGRNPRGRPRSTMMKDDGEEEENGLRESRKSIKSAIKRPARESDDDPDEDWEPEASSPPRADGLQDDPAVKKKRKTNRYPCPIGGCKETFTRKNDVRRHIQNAAVHRGSVEAIQWQSKAGTRCTLCNADLSRSDARMRHERTSACGKRTTQKMKDQMIVMRV
ncbi:hypothetical protein E1B28_010075 [Marasmius oreades]|nr:uncharacterized protein E1B28_010075 [Marasmius oreades]KAG7091012.1 hypothetical protein E1B28_010075 [Marasmius oreades]